MLEDMKNILEPTPITPTEERIQLAKEKRLWYKYLCKWPNILQGNQAFQKGDYQEALSHYSMAIQYDPA